MAFKDQMAVMYEGSVRVTYLDRPHAYYKQDRIDYGLPETDDKAWGPKTRPKGVTTILGDTLEKKGLMAWPLGLALTELFGFYDFEPEPGNRLTGFSKGKGTLWELMQDEPLATPSEFLPLVLSASKAWQRKQKQGADIGSAVHSKIEEFVNWSSQFELTLAEYEAMQEFENEEQRQAWLVTAPAEVEMANLALYRFIDWWNETKPELINAEQIVYSKEYDYAGAYDALLRIDGRIIVEDHKTTKVSIPAGAPQGVYYSYFIQSALYAICLLEMGAVDRVDDLMVVSCRKDGGFDVVMATDVGLTMPEALDWAKAVITCHKFMASTKAGLVANAR